jgi:hypothetical protein
MLKVLRYGFFMAVSITVATFWAATQFSLVNEYQLIREIGCLNLCLPVPSKQNLFFNQLQPFPDLLCDFLVTDPEVLGSITGATTFSDN